MAQGFDAVALGRVLLAEPDYVNKLRPVPAVTPSARRAIAAWR